jgi:hypothetical protein
MKTGPLTIEELVEAFRELGGEAEWADVREKIADGRQRSTTGYKDKRNFDTTLWQVLYLHCPGSGKYAGNPIFQKVGDSRFRLLDFDPRSPVSPNMMPAELAGLEAAVRRSREVNEFKRSPGLVEEIKRMYGSSCQLCGIRRLLPSGAVYAEAHHIHGLVRTARMISQTCCACVRTAMPSSI